MSKGALFRGPPAARGVIAAMTCVLALGASAQPSSALESRSFQDMLVVAIRQNDVAAVRSLLASGADVAKRNTGGKTAIDIAIELARFEIAELLVAERRRQREAQLAAPPRNTIPAEVVQPSAEAAPVVASMAPPPPRIDSQPPAAGPTPAVAPPPTVALQAIEPAPVPRVAAPTLPPAPVTPEQLMALAQQLLQAAQVLAAAQARVVHPPPSIAPPAVSMASPPSPPIEVAVARTAEPFMPKPGRKPTIEAPAEPEPEPIAAAPRESVVVTPRRRTPESAVDRLRDSLESEAELPVVSTSPRPTPPAPPRAAAPKPQPSIQPAAVPLTPSPEPELEDEDAELEAEPAQPPSDVMNAINGIGSFFGLSPQPNKPDPKAAPVPGGPRELRDQLRASEPRRRNVPHVPAKRASEIRADAAPAETEPVNAPTDAARATPLSLAPRTANPFDPDALPQGAVLPYTDPQAGNAPEVARAEPPARPAPSAKPAAKAAPAPPPQVAPKPDVPPLADVQKARDANAAPTSAFERRPLPRAVQPAPKEEVGVLKSLATAIGLPDGDEAEPDGGDAGDVDKLTSRKMPLMNLRPPLADVRLTLGASVTTEARQLPRGLAEPDPCIRRSGGTVMFCIVPVDWPAPVDAAFSLTTYLYQGTRAIARYDGGKATHYHALFASQHYRDVVAYFANRYGPPTDEWKRSIAPFDRPRQPNPTLVWRSRDSRTNQVTILEVRQYDDTRNVFPDMEHGAVRLYKSGAQRVFPVITGLDIMGIDWAARSDHTDGTDPRALANTIRPRR